MATVTVPNSFTNGTTADADEVNQNFNALKDFANNSTVHVDGSQAFTSSVDAGSNKVINVSAPTAATDAANKTYVDTAIDTDVATHAAVTSSVHGISSFGATLVDDASASAARTTLGLGSIAVQSTINNDDWSGTDLALTNGGTGASNASGARTNLGLGSLAVQSTIDESDIDSAAVTRTKLDVQIGSTYETSTSTTVTTTPATILSTNVSCASGSYAVITLSVDVTWSDSPTTNCDTVYAELLLNGTAQNGQIIMRPFEVASSGDVRWTGTRTWMVSMPAMSSDAIAIRIAKLQNNNSVVVNGSATAADSHTRIEYMIFNA